jgi:hypothetical protein
MCNDAVYQSLYRYSKYCYCYFDMHHNIRKLS